MQASTSCSITSGDRPPRPRSRPSRRRDNETTRLRYVQIGQAAGRTIPLDAAVLRSNAVELVGSGFGSVALPDLLASIRDFFAEASRQPFHIDVRTFPLSDVASAWNEPEGNTRFVFIP